MPCLADSSHGASKILAFIFMRVSCCNSGTTASSFCNNRHAMRIEGGRHLSATFAATNPFNGFPAYGSPKIPVDCGLMQCKQFEWDHRDAPGIRERFRLELFPRVDAVYEMPLERLARPHQVAREEIFFRLARAHQDWPHR